MGGKFDVVAGGPISISLVLVHEVMLTTIGSYIILISPIEQLMKEGFHTSNSTIEDIPGIST